MSGDEQGHAGETVQVWMDKDEWYPVYDCTTKPDRWREGPFIVPRALAERFDRALVEWTAVQEELSEVYNRPRVSS